MQKFIHKKGGILFKKNLASEIFLIRFHSGIASKLSLPGQFLHIEIEGKSLRRPLSIFNRGKDWLEIIFRVSGEGTLLLSRKRKGEHLDFIGPLGRGFPVEGKRPLFLAGGLGMAPLHFLARVLKAKGAFIYGVKKEEEFVPLKKTGYKLIKVSEERERKKITDVLPLYIKDADVVYAAGPRQMLKKVALYCLRLGKKGYLSWEERMGCGIGLCQCCVVKTKDGYKKTCEQGPVFSFSEIDWNPALLQRK